MSVKSEDDDLIATREKLNSNKSEILKKAKKIESALMMRENEKYSNKRLNSDAAKKRGAS